MNLKEKYINGIYLTQRFKKLNIKNIIELLKNEAYYPYPHEHWIREKKYVISLLEEGIQNYTHLINKRMEDVQNTMKIYLHEVTDNLNEHDMKSTKLQWLYDMSYISQDMEDINDLRAMLSEVKALEFTLEPIIYNFGGSNGS